MYKKILSFFFALLMIFSGAVSAVAAETDVFPAGAYTDPSEARGALGELISAAVKILQSSEFRTYPADMCSRFEQAYAEANGVYYNPDSSLEQVNAQIEKLQGVIDEVKGQGVSENAAYYLSSAITDAEFKVGSELEYTADSYAEYTEALAEAKRVQKEGRTDGEVIAAADALKSAVASLVPVSPAVSSAREYLRNTLNKAYNVLSGDDNYTDESISELESVIAQAEALYYNPSATAGELYYEADLIMNTINSMEEIIISESVRNYLAGVIALADSKVGSEEDYTPESWSVYFDAYQEAVRVQSIGKDEEEFTSAANALGEAISALVPVDAAVTAARNALMTVITSAHGTLNGTDRYTKESVENLRDALNSANEVYVREDATEQELNSETLKVQNAMDSLVKITVSEEVMGYLAGVIALAESKVLGEEEYTPESWSVYQSAYLEALRVQREGESEEEYTSAANALGEAMEGLVSADAELQKARAELLELLEYTLTEGIYTPESVAFFNAAKAKATDVYNDESATCEDVKAEAEAIRNAISGLVILPTTSEAKNKLAAVISSCDNVEIYDEIIFYSADEFTSALNNAKVVFDSEASDEDYEKATDSLTSAYDALLKEAREELLKLIRSGIPIGGNFTSSSVEALDKALRDATEVYDNEDAGLKDIMAQIKSVILANKGLQVVPVTPEAKATLWNVIEKSQLLVGDREDYTPESWRAYSEAYSNAMATYHYGDNDSEYYLAAQMLQSAMDSLVPLTTEPDPPYEEEPTPDEIFVILGDVDGNGKVNVKDATLVQKNAAGLAPLTDLRFFAADANSDTKVNVRDATEIQKHLAGLKSNDNIGKEIPFKAL